MSFIQIYNRWCKSKAFWFVYVMMYVFIGVLTVIGYNSIYELNSPLKDAEGFINTTRRNETIEVTYTRTFTVQRDFVGTVHREVVHEGSGYRYEFPGFHRSFKEGTYTRTRTLLMPAGVPEGRYVLKTYVIWKPSFSIREHFTEVPDISFKVCGKFEMCGVKDD